MYTGGPVHYHGAIVPLPRHTVPRSMTLAAEDIDFIRGHLVEWLAEQGLSEAPHAALQRELFERVVRVEEELKHQRELMQQGFAAMERRFEQIDKRFEQIDKRFEQVEKRFEQVDKRIEQVDKRIEQVDKRIEQIERRFEQVDKRFEQVERRFDQVDKHFEQMERRFEQVDRRFEALTRRIDRFMIWSFGLTASAVVIILSVLRLWMTSP
jgi:chromosome segregation ATPase